MLTTHLIEQIIAGKTPVGTSFRVTVGSVEPDFGGRLTVSLSFSIVDKDSRTLVVLAEAKRLHAGDEVTIADIHQAFTVTISGS